MDKDDFLDLLENEILTMSNAQLNELIEACEEEKAKRDAMDAMMED